MNRARSRKGVEGSLRQQSYFVFANICDGCIGEGSCCLCLGRKRKPRRAGLRGAEKKVGFDFGASL